MEPPQPGDQTAHNHGGAITAFGNLEYVAGPSDTLSLLLNTAPAQTQVANRTGLPDKYAPVGQGFGYGGARNADGSEAGTAPDPTVVGSQVLPITSQQGSNQDVYQNDENRFGVFNYRHSFGGSLTGLLSLGATSARLDIRNHNPSIDPNSVDPATGLLNTIDNSIEYNPTILRKSSQSELSGSLTKSAGTHTYKGGFLLTSQVGDESYQIIPQSQLALDAEAAIQSGGGPQLTPSGTYQMDGSGNPVLDTLGNQVYQINPASTSTPTVAVHRSGYYNAFYGQDTWRATRQFTVNYGLRLDSYYGKQSLSPDTVKKNYLSPRLNLAYAVTPATTLRLDYDKLFSQPPLAQGAILGTNLVPQTTDLYEIGVDRRLSPLQNLKVSYYYKNARNEFDTGLLIPYTQFGAYTTLQYTSQGVHGFELSYDFAARGNVGLGGFLAYTNSIAKPNGVDQTGARAPIVNDHDQLNTLSAGLSYTLPSQAFGGLDVYYGSGEASSVLAPIGASNSNVLNNGSRNSHYSVDLRLGHPHLLGCGGPGAGCGEPDEQRQRAQLQFRLQRHPLPAGPPAGSARDRRVLGVEGERHACCLDTPAGAGPAGAVRPARPVQPLPRLPGTRAPPRPGGPGRGPVPAGAGPHGGGAVVGPRVGPGRRPRRLHGRGLAPAEPAPVSRLPPVPRGGGRGG